MEQTFIQVRVDAELKDEATRTMEKIGMDMPNAIRMFLKRIVIEGGLPFEAKLPRVEDAEKRNESRAVCIPAQSVLYVSMEEYIELLCLVPKGKITRRDDIEKYLQKKHGAERVMIDMRPLYANPLWEGIVCSVREHPDSGDIFAVHCKLHIISRFQLNSSFSTVISCSEQIFKHIC